MAKGCPSSFRGGIFWITDNNQRCVKKYLFTLPIFDLMHNPVLTGIPIIPLKTNNLLEFVLHD
jgi:hypothetical protein